jgi:hypothetical protein
MSGIYLDFENQMPYKYFMQITNEIKTSLRREYNLCSGAIAFYKKALKGFEQKYRTTTSTFLKKFESGRLGDDSDYFDWYAFAKLLSKWQEIRSAIQSAIK